MILVDGGMSWKEVPSTSTSVNLHSEDENFNIIMTKNGKFRLISFQHNPSKMFPQAEFWMMEYDSLLDAARQAEKM